MKKSVIKYLDRITIISSFFFIIFLFIAPLSSAICDEYLNDCKRSGWQEGKTYCLNQDVFTKTDNYLGEIDLETGTIESEAVREFICFAIDKSNVVLDGQGHKLYKGKGCGGHYGVIINGNLNNVIVKNLEIINFSYRSIKAQKTSNCQILNNTIIHKKGNIVTGIFAPSSINIIISGNTIIGGRYGMDLGGSDSWGPSRSDGSSGTVSDNVIETSDFYSIAGGSRISFVNNIFLNTCSEKQKVAKTYPKTIETSKTATGNEIIYRNNYGEIKWIDNDWSTNIMINGCVDLTFPGTIGIGYNSIYFNPSGFTKRIDSKAELTINGVPASLTNPKILRDGQECNSATYPACNLMSSNYGTIKFSVSPGISVGSEGSTYSIDGLGSSPAAAGLTTPSVPESETPKSVSDTIPPTFLNLEDKTIASGQSLLYDIDASDNSGILCFNVDDTTNFNIDCNGVLRSLIPLNVGTYRINITAIDNNNNPFSRIISIISSVCNPNWIAVNTTCQSGDLFVQWFNDTNRCNLIPLANLSYGCDYNNDGVIGDRNSIIQVNLYLDLIVNSLLGSTKLVELKEGDITRVKFNYSFTPLDLRSIYVEKQTGMSRVGYIIVHGINESKSLVIDRISPSSNQICIKSAKSVIFSNFTPNCNSFDEILASCPESFNQFSCSILNNQFLVNGLTGDLAVREILNLSSPGIMDSGIKQADVDPVDCSNGCILNDRCIPIGYRQENKYCDYSGDFIIQSNTDSPCENNFECSTNLCINNKCISQNIWQKFLDWLGGIF